MDIGFEKIFMSYFILFLCTAMFLIKPKNLIKMQLGGLSDRILGYRVDKVINLLVAWLCFFIAVVIGYQALFD